MKKVITGTIAIMLIVIASAYTINKDNHNNNKDANKRVSYYWYPITYDSAHPLGQIEEDATPLFGEKSSIPATCPSGNVRDCYRAYTAPLDEVTYPTPTSVDQIKRN